MRMAAFPFNRPTAFATLYFGVYPDLRQALAREQQRANQALNQRRLWIDHVNSSVKRCRIVKDRIRLWKEGVRDLVMELCCALHNFRARLTPWQPMI
jgi:hypothetical protein